MKNVEVIHSTASAWRIPIQGLPPLRGWAVQYVSGMDAAIKAGYWLSFWRVNSARDSATFSFEAGLHMCFDGETEANAISDALRRFAEIETRVVEI
jgi:hypothetical protein